MAQVTVVDLASTQATRTSRADERRTGATVGPPQRTTTPRCVLS
jgi:hypothetical protein